MLIFALFPVVRFANPAARRGRIWGSRRCVARSVCLGATLLAVACVSGCDRERSIDRLESQVAENLTERWASVSGDTLDRLERLFVPDGEMVEHEDNAAAERGTTLDRPFEMEGGACTAAIASDDSGTDIDLLLVSPAGQVVARDDGTDSFPLIARYCAQETGIYTYRIRARGDATVRWRRYEVPSEDGDMMLRSMLESYEGTHRAAIPPQTNALREGKRFSTPFVAEEGRCYRVLAAAMDGIGDLDIYVYDRAYDARAVLQELAVDSDPRTRPVCADRTSRWDVEFRAHRGSGRFRWQIFEVGEVSRDESLVIGARPPIDPQSAVSGEAGSAAPEGFERIQGAPDGATPTSPE